MSKMSTWILVIGGILLVIVVVVRLIKSFFTMDIPNVLKGKQSCLDTLIYLIGGIIAVVALIVYMVCELLGI